MFSSQPFVMLGAATSDLTGSPMLIADYRQLSVSIQSSTASASRFTFVGTNDNGLSSALGTPSQTVPSGGWSIITTITNEGMYVLDTGFRWINAFRPGIAVSASSNVTITLQGRA